MYQEAERIVDTSQSLAELSNDVDTQQAHRVDSKHKGSTLWV